MKIKKKKTNNIKNNLINKYIYIYIYIYIYNIYILNGFIFLFDIYKRNKLKINTNNYKKYIFFL